MAVTKQNIFYLTNKKIFIVKKFANNLYSKPKDRYGIFYL